MPFEKLQELAQGRVYTGRMAKKLGLVDELGTLDDAIVAAKTAAGLKADAKVELMVLPEPKSIFEQLFGDPAATTDMESLLPEGFAAPSPDGHAAAVALAADSVVDALRAATEVAHAQSKRSRGDCPDFCRRQRRDLAKVATRRKNGSVPLRRARGHSSRCEMVGISARHVAKRPNGNYNNGG